MNNEYVRKNIIISIAFLITIGIMVLILKYALGKLLDKIDVLSKSITQKLKHKITWKYSIVLTDIGILILTVISINIYFLYNQKPLVVILAMIIYMFLMGVLGSLLASLKETLNNSFSILELIGKKIEKWHKSFCNNFSRKYYIINSVILYVKQIFSFDTLFLLVITYISGIIFTLPNWPEQFFYGICFLFPLYLNIWIHFPLRKSRKDERATNGRRIIVYLAVAVFTIIYNFGNFITYLEIEKQLAKDFNSFLLNTSNIIFFAIERVFKVWTDDRKKFNESNSSDPEKV